MKSSSAPLPPAVAGPTGQCACGNQATDQPQDTSPASLRTTAPPPSPLLPQTPRETPTPITRARPPMKTSPSSSARIPRWDLNGLESDMLKITGYPRAMTSTTPGSAPSPRWSAPAPRSCWMAGSSQFAFNFGNPLCTTQETGYPRGRHRLPDPLSSTICWPAACTISARPYPP